MSRSSERRHSDQTMKYSSWSLQLVFYLQIFWKMYVLISPSSVLIPIRTSIGPSGQDIRIILPITYISDFYFLFFYLHWRKSAKLVLNHNLFLFPMYFCLFYIHIIYIQKIVVSLFINIDNSCSQMTLIQDRNVSMSFKNKNIT